MGRGRKQAQPAAEMAPGPASNIGATNLNSKKIPLLCTVCPDAPRFSDVSHLLTHIASKGHLHHETQTKLRAHQDLAASVVLESYEDWYSRNGIEALLVDRMKAKQQKEAARSRRNRSILTASVKEGKRKSKRGIRNSSLIKMEEADLSSDYPIYPGLFGNSDDEVEVPDDCSGGADMLSLKGQIWPGMGKMDLANEEMKRTRNQRKPKSVIEKMRRASEVIEPTQVIMTSEFEVERVKGVYDDSSSPVPGQDESTPPRKVQRGKRRKLRPLTEVSTNVPRQRRSNARGSRTQATRKTVPDNLKNADEKPALMLSQAPFRSTQDVFQDDGDGISDPYGHRRFPALSLSDQRLSINDRLGTMPSLNPISQPNLISPTPASRDVARIFGTRDIGHGRTQQSPQPYLGMLMTRKGSFSQLEAAYAIREATIYNGSSRPAFNPSSQFSGASQEPFGMSSSGSIQPKQADHANQITERLSGGHFVDLAGTNPLLSHDRLFLTSFTQPQANLSLRSLAFTPINRPREQLHDPRDIGLGSSNDEGSKLEVQTCDEGVNGHFSNDKDLSLHGTWGLQHPGSDMDLHNHLNPEDLRI
ncbi:hypothetical protein BGZ63DRAFT_400385 [Mariannaea sp. PMI_226]|nr:hypothetical protein BGZ63DRAFT_400385 [Mariannaea sp. PMI_226]